MGIGERRSLVASFHSLIDPGDERRQFGLLQVCVAAIDDWGRNGADEELGANFKSFVRSLQCDGAPIHDLGNIHAVGSPPMVLPMDGSERLSQPHVLTKHLERIGESLAKNPAASIGSSKELVESTCKFVLDDYGFAYAQTASLLDLYIATAAALAINREAVEGSRKRSESAQRILQNLATAVQSMAELRNELGLGHGKTSVSPALECHARLAFNAARTVVEFVLQTWHQRRTIPGS